MRNIIRHSPKVAEAFFNLTREIRADSRLDNKTNELVLIGIFAAHRGLRGIGTHVERALEAGATKEEILSAILLAMPVVGVSNVTLAFEAALAKLEDVEVPVHAHAD